MEVAIKHEKEEADWEIYNFEHSGIGDSWLIGTNTATDANAFIKGVSACPIELRVPEKLTDQSGATKYVEVIGQMAYYRCGRDNYNGKTKTVIITPQVKIIKDRGFAAMWDTTSFIIEAGSKLQTIESHGLEYMGRNFQSIKETLILPSTLSSVYVDGIHQCNLFNIIIYCGSTFLSNSSSLVTSDFQCTVKVSNEYPQDKTIFGFTPERDSYEEVAIFCPVIITETTETTSASTLHVVFFVWLFI